MKLDDVQATYLMMKDLSIDLDSESYSFPAAKSTRQTNHRDSHVKKRMFHRFPKKLFCSLEMAGNDEATLDFYNEIITWGNSDMIKRAHKYALVAAIRSNNYRYYYFQKSYFGQFNKH